MLDMKTKSGGFAAPSLEGRRGMSVGSRTSRVLRIDDDGDFSSPKERCGAAFPGWVSFNWGKLLKVIIAVLTALACAIGVASCTAKL